MGTVLTYEQLGRLNAKWFAILKQMHQRDGYPFNPQDLEKSLQMLFEGKFLIDRQADPLGIRTSVSYLPWSFVYDELRMYQEFRDFDFEERRDLWTVPVVEGVTIAKVIRAFRNHAVSSHGDYFEDVETEALINDRDPARDGSYVVSFKQNVEADPELLFKSTSDLKRAGVRGITLLERLLLGFAYFLQTKDNLDVAYGTLCTGSRYSNDRVPYVHFSNEDSGISGIYISRCHVLAVNPRIRARAVVS